MKKESRSSLFWKSFRFVRKIFFLCVFFVVSFSAALLYRLSLGPLSLDKVVPYFVGSEISCKTFQLQWISGLRLELVGEKICGASFSIPRISVFFSLPKLFYGSWKPESLFLESPSFHISCQATSQGSQTINLPFEWRNVVLDIRNATITAEFPDGVTIHYQRLHLHAERHPHSKYHISLWQRPLSRDAESELFCVMDYTLKKGKVYFSGKIHGLPVDLHLLWPELRGIMHITGKFSGYTTSSLSSWSVKGNMEQKDSCLMGLLDKKPQAVIKNFYTKMEACSEGTCDVQGGAFLDAAGFKWSLIGKTIDNRFSFQGKLCLYTGYISAESLAYSWPPSVGANARSWILENFRKGEFAQAEGVFDGHWSSTDGVMADDFQGILGIQNVVLSFIPGVPFIHNLKAISSVDLKKFSIDIVGGDFQGQKITKGKITIGPLVGLPLLGMDLFIEGPLKPLLETLNCPRFGFLEHVPLDMNSVKGQWKGKLSSIFPLLMKLKVDDILIKVNGFLKDAGFAIQLSGVPLNVSRGDLAVSLTEKDIFLKGKSILHNIPITWSLQQDFYNTEEGCLDIISHTVWSNLESVFPQIKGFCRGSVKAHVLYYPSKKSKQVKISMDLEHSAITVPWIQWKKIPNIPMKAASVVSLENGKKIKSVHLQSTGALQGKGDVFWGEDQGTWDIEKAVINISHPVSYTAAYSYSPQGGYLLNFKGPVIDLSSILSGGASSEKTLSSSLQEKKDIFESRLQEQNLVFLHTFCSPHEDKWRVQLSCKKCILSGAVIENLQGNLQGTVQKIPMASWLDTIKWGKGDIQGIFSVLTRDPSSSSEKKQVASTALLHFSSVPQTSGETRIALSSHDGGGFLQGFGIATEVYGGKLNVSIVQKGHGNYRGSFILSDTKVQTPYLIKILAMISPTAFLEFFSSKLLFPLIKGNVSYKDGSLILKKFVARGINLGLFVEGEVSLIKKSMMIHGVLVPAYWLNTIFTYVPLLGWVFGKDKGILSTEFTLSGPFDDPHVSIDPLSIFKVGFLKSFFDALDGDKSP